MDARRKQELKELMVTAWNLARFGANRFGGPASMYFWMALRIAWRERGGKSVYYTKGNVAQMWMGIVPRQEKVKRGGNATYRPDTKRSQVLHVRIEFGSCPPKSQ